MPIGGAPACFRFNVVNTILDDFFIHVSSLPRACRTRHTQKPKNASFLLEPCSLRAVLSRNSKCKMRHTCDTHKRCATCLLGLLVFSWVFPVMLQYRCE
jgi:hypothetical protein